jgi:hypothetical protein
MSSQKVLEKRVLDLQTKLNHKTELLNRILTAEEKLSSQYYWLEKFVRDSVWEAHGYGIDTVSEELDKFAEVIQKVKEELKNVR